MGTHAKHRPEVVTFASAFKHARTKHGFSYSDVSRRIGQSTDTVKEWESGTAFPRGRDIPRLCSVMRDLRPYVRLIPKQHLETEEDVRGMQVASATVAAGPPPPLPVAPVPTTFHEALRQERLSAGVSQRELGELVGVHPATIAIWEDTSVPVRVNYQKLIDLLPGLKNGPVPDVQDIDPPVGTKYKHNGIIKGEPPKKEEEPVVAQQETQPIAPPAAVSTEPHKPTLPELAANWSEALVKQNSARLFFDEVEKTYQEAKAELEEAEIELELAKKAVDEAALATARSNKRTK